MYCYERFSQNKKFIKTILSYSMFFYYDSSFLCYCLFPPNKCSLCILFKHSVWLPTHHMLIDLIFFPYHIAIFVLFILRIKGLYPHIFVFWERGHTNQWSKVTLSLQLGIIPGCAWDHMGGWVWTGLVIYKALALFFL